MTQVFLYTGVNSFPHLDDTWNPDDAKVEIISAGGVATTWNGGEFTDTAGAGGAGGTYVWGASPYPQPPVQTAIMSMGQGSVSSFTTWNGTALSGGAFPSRVSVSQYNGAFRAIGGTATQISGNVTPRQGFAGGQGGGAGNSSTNRSGGGGAAGGPAGAGGAAAVGTPAPGGSTAGGAAGGATAGQWGANGREFDNIHGAGAGGAGGVPGGIHGGSGGYFGGGAGGSGAVGNQAGSPRPGLIVVSWTPKERTLVFLYPGVIRLEEPPGWDPEDNQVWCIGAGGTGGSTGSGPWDWGGAGGGGGAIGWARNLTPAWPLPVAVTVNPSFQFTIFACLFGSVGAVGYTSPGWLGTATTPPEGTLVWAQSGFATYLNSGGAGGTSFGPAGFAGGNGGAGGEYYAVQMGAAGGGAGGPQGAGGAGDPSNASWGANGGTADGGAVLSSGYFTLTGGLTGRQWDQLHGPSGGGAGGHGNAELRNGKPGGRFGGGGGGGANQGFMVPGGTNGHSLIVLSYGQAKPPRQAAFMA